VLWLWTQKEVCGRQHFCCTLSEFCHSALFVHTQYKITMWLPVFMQKTALSVHLLSWVLVLLQEDYSVILFSGGLTRHSKIKWKVKCKQCPSGTLDFLRNSYCIFSFSSIWRKVDRTNLSRKVAHNRTGGKGTKGKFPFLLECKVNFLHRKGASRRLLLISSWLQLNCKLYFSPCISLNLIFCAPYLTKLYCYCYVSFLVNA
jgi:hypothetical protein